MNKAIFAGLILAASALSTNADAATVLTFEGLSNNEAVGNYYNGGAGGNYGISFVNAIGVIDADEGGTGNFANEPSGKTTISFSSGTASTMNVSAGFTTGFSFFYSSSAAVSVSVFDGLNGTGTLLATLNLVPQSNLGCTGDPTGVFCNFTPVGVTFAGVARSVNFSGTANRVGFDDITVGAETPGGAVPEPASWAMMIAGLGLAGASMRRRKSLAQFA